MTQPQSLTRDELLAELQQAKTMKAPIYKPLHFSYSY